MNFLKSGSMTLADAESATTTFTMPAGAVRVKATYKSASHTHCYGSEWESDADKHWHECSCGAKSEEVAHSFKWVVDQEATATPKGSKHEECEVCGYQRPAVEIPATGSESLSYQIIEGANGSWTQNTDDTLTFCANGDFTKFTGVQVDDKAIGSANYTAKSGSTIVTLKADYLKTLSEGKHKLTVVFNDGECSTYFTVKAAHSTSEPTENNPNTDASDKAPQTGDNSNKILWIVLLLVPGLGVTGTVVYSKRKKYVK